MPQQPEKPGITLKAISRIRRWAQLLVVGMFLIAGGLEATQYEDAQPRPVLTLGLFTYFSSEEIRACCQPVIDYLNANIEALNIRLKPINLHDVDDALASNELDFIITNPGHYIQLRERYNIKNPVATIVRQSEDNKVIHRSGGVIFALKQRKDVSQLEDIRGKWIAAAGTRHLSGYEAQAYELLQAGIQLPRDAHVMETGSFNTVLEAVHAGNVDVGFLPANVFHGFQAKGLADDLKIINIKEHPGFPYEVSTRLYPQWPVVALPHVSQEQVNAIRSLLFTLSADHPVAINARIAGFSPAADYQPVEQILRALELPPYDQAPTITFGDIWRQHQITSILSLIAISIILLLMHLLAKRNRQLQSQRLLAEDSASHFEQILDATRAGTWKWNVKTGYAIFNERWAEIVGYRLAELSPISAETLVQLSHPEDLKKAQKLLQKHFRGETPDFEADFRMRHKQGHWVWVHSRGRVTHWEADGSPMWMFGTHMDETERVVAARQLQANQAKYQRLVDNVGEKFIIYSHHGLEGEITYVSDGVTNVFGLQREDIVGTRWMDLANWLPQDVEKAKRYIALRMSGKADFLQFEMRFIHPAGGERTLRVSSRPVRDSQGTLVAIDGIAEDITEQKRSQERAYQAATVFAHSQESIIITNTNANILDCNPATGRLTGYSREELIGQNPRIFASGTHTAGFYKHLWDTLGSGHIWQGTFRNLRKNGTPYWIETSISPIKDQNGKIIQYVAVSRDITRKKAQLEALRQAKREAQAANTAKSEFVANISHEIRTPMNAILGFTDLCLESNPSSLQRKYLGNVRDSARNMLSLINELLDFSKIEAGKLSMESIPFDLGKEMSSLLAMTRQLINTNQVKLQLDYQVDFEGWLKGDPLRLKQVLTNLASNAVKFTNKGQITISVREISRNKDNIELEFMVCDTGIGMNVDKLDSIFRPFSQADSSTTRNFGGTGLGLTISSELINKMGGRIQVESEPGIGSSFYFRLCFPLIEGPLADKTQRIARRRSFTRLQNTRVLLVEDNQVNRELATEVLRRHGLIVDTAGNGQEALDKLSEQSYELILMDIQMPVMDGYEATKNIRSKLGLVRLPIIALTASSSSRVREKCIQAGMDDYLSKPIDIHELMEMIDRFINPMVNKIAATQAPIPFSKAAPEHQLPEIPGVDADQAMQRLSIEHDSYLQLLKKFARRHKNDIEEIISLLEQDGQDDARRMAHTLKGLAGTIGATELSSHMAKVEQAIKKQIPQESQLELLVPAQEELQTIVSRIETMDDSIPPPPENSAQPDTDIHKEIHALIKLTEEYNVAAVSEVDRLMQLIGENPLVDELQNIRDDLENYDFDAATSGLKKLMEQL
ncbi:PAS domain S-box protein [Thiolapillus brandeum]|uniref:Sensory/regulatory protein RpfC n=1 Tax=Thiolapillus brandeum TaxID=1076588 RepID=A0A7U6GL96_9GAMM|nr:PAS domain S-box protein [Thiolapillus brandeum]BAO45709.1 two-component sensor histidine kinase / response regulator [Thiolapillus brandeum]